VPIVCRNPGRPKLGRNRQPKMAGKKESTKSAEADNRWQRRKIRSCLILAFMFVLPLYNRVNRFQAVMLSVAKHLVCKLAEDIATRQEILLCSLGQPSMGKRSLFVLLNICLIISLLLAGCVQRKLTVNTEPQGALVILNDEEIGVSPVTVSFEWYGDYRVRIQKEGYETLKTHRELDAPWYDGFPFDFFTMLNPKRTVDSYEWTFTLAPQKQPSREELIQNAEEMKKQLQ
jgi:hypothetical protein